MSAKRHVAETIHDGVSLRFEVEETLYSEATSHQRLELVRNRIFGKVLLLDGAVQVTSADEFMYHEMMAHVPLMAHDDPRDVLIVGGGDCGLAEEVLKHERVRSLTQVEIDPSVIDFSRRHFSDFNKAVFTDDRFHVEIADGAAFVSETENRFDVILVDSTDPAGPGAVLFTPRFYRDLRKSLRPGGIAVTQNGVPFLQGKEFLGAISALSGAFEAITCYLVAVPTYFGGHMTLGWSSDSVKPLQVPVDVLKHRMGNIATRYYTPEHHGAAFVLPRYIQDLLEQARG